MVDNGYKEDKCPLCWEYKPDYMEICINCETKMRNEYNHEYDELIGLAEYFKNKGLKTEKEA